MPALAGQLKDGSLGLLAYTIAFVAPNIPDNANSNGIILRRIADAITTLGFSVSYNANNTIADITNSYGASEANVQAFASRLAINYEVILSTYNDLTNISTAVNLLQAALDAYTVPLGYCVAPAGDTIATIFTDQEIPNFSLSTATLEKTVADINHVASASASLPAGQIIMLPIISEIVPSTPFQIGPSSINAYYYDVSTNIVVETAAKANGSNAGSLTVVNGSGAILGVIDKNTPSDIKVGPSGNAQIDLPNGHDIVLTTGDGGYLDNIDAVHFSADGSFVIREVGDPSVQVVFDNDSGSQVVDYELDTSAETITGFSEPDGTGNPTAQVENTADGSSIITTYPGSGSETVTAYTGPNGTGTAETSTYQGLPDFYQWIGGQGDFADASQWLDQDLNPPTSDYSPGLSSFVEFESGGQVTGSGAVNSVTVNSQVTFTGTVQTSSFINNGQIDIQGTLLANSVEGGDATVEGTIAVVSGGFSALDIKSGGDVETGGGAVTGDVTIEAGGTFSDDNTLIGGANGATLTFRVDGADASWSSGLSTFIGDGDGSAAVTVSDGAFANLATGFGVSNLILAAAGANSLTIASGGEVSVADPGASSYVEADSSHSGSIIVKGTGSELDSPEASLAVYGQASFSVLDGAAASLVGLDMNDLSGEGTGSSTIDGAQTNLNTVTLDIDDGTLTVSNNAQLTLGGVIKSVTDDATGSLDTFAAAIGNSGSGVVQVESGAAITADPDSIGGSFELGGLAGSEGALTVSGPNSLVDLNQGGFIVGTFGSGTIKISDGGEVDAESVTVAEVGGQGQVSVTGDGSYLSVDSVLAVGGQTSSGGQAILQISYGGIVDAADVEVGATGSIILSAGELDTDPVTVDMGGNISGNGLVSGDVTNSGTITATGGTLELTDDISGNGTLVIDPNSTLLLDGAVDASVTIEFASGGSGTLELADSADFSGVIVGQSAGDQVVDVACFVRGTRITTSLGEISVETLIIGDRVFTASGLLRSVRWVGRRSYSARLIAGRPALWPIRFRAGSLGGGLPCRDLRVSADHALFIHGLLISARHLVNGTTITRERPSGDLLYFHIELETHDVILAEGAPVESFLDDDSRQIFHNAAEFAVLYPEAGPLGRFCAPRVENGYELEAVRRRLNAVAEDQRQAA